MAGSNKVLAAIDAVMEEIGKSGISKDRDNKQQGYAFRGIDDVYNALAPVLAKHHLIIIPTILSRDVTERATQKGGVLFYVVVQAKWTLASSEDGSSVEAVTYGEAMDSGDKATNKAMSAAYKYMAMMTFCIPTEGDNDADSTTHDVAPLRPGGRQPLAVTAAESAIIMCMTLDELKEWGAGNAEMINSLPADQGAKISAAYKVRFAALKAETKPAPKPEPKEVFTRDLDDEIPF